MKYGCKTKLDKQKIINLIVNKQSVDNMKGKLKIWWAKSIIIKIIQKT